MPKSLQGRSPLSFLTFVLLVIVSIGATLVALYGRVFARRNPIAARHE